MTTYQAPAKINLSLRVQTRVREDGYHNVDILMAPIDLYDQLDFHNSRTTTLLCDTPGVPTDESNLVFKAIREFEKAYGRKAKQRIQGILYGEANPAFIARGLKEITRICSLPFMADKDIINFNPFIKDEAANVADDQDS
jgi:4-diphosphocytidyl-2-C-methyl-D-erythritol kinase